MPNGEFQVKMFRFSAPTMGSSSLPLFFARREARSDHGVVCVGNSLRDLQWVVSFLARRTIFYHFSEFRIAHQGPLARR